MNRRWLAVALLLWTSQAFAEVRVFPSGYLSLADLSQSYPDIHANLLPLLDAVVRVRLTNSEQQQVGAGSGTLVSTPTGVVLKTALHVVKPIFSPKGKCDDARVKIEVVGANQTEVLTCASLLPAIAGAAQTDLAVFTIKGAWKGTILPMATTLNTGDEVLLVGYPEIMNGGLVTSLGHVLMGTNLGAARILLSASASPGMSGGLVLKVGKEGRLELLGDIVNQLSADRLVSLPIRYNWGTKPYERQVCLNQDDYNGLLYNGSYTGVSFKARLIKTTQFVLSRKVCKAATWTWSQGLRASLDQYKSLISRYSKEKSDSVFPLHDRFSEDYRMLVQKDPFEALKTADFPLSPGPGYYDPTLSLAHFDEILESLGSELSQFDEKLIRIKSLFPKTMQLSEWLTAIQKLDMEHQVSAVNDYYLFGLGVVETW